MLSFIAVTTWLTISLYNGPKEKDKGLIIAMLVLSGAIVVIFTIAIFFAIAQRKIAIQYDENGIVINNRTKISLSFDEIDKCMYQAKNVYIFDTKIQFGTIYVKTKDKEYKVDSVKNPKQITLELNHLKENYMANKSEK